MSLSRISLIDLFPNDSPIVESLGLASLSAVLKANGYETMLEAYNQGNIDYQKLFTFNPGIVCFTVRVETIQIVNEACKEILKTLPNVYFIIGGYLATNSTNQVLKDIPHIHFAIRGEGEETLVQLLFAISNSDGFDEIDGLTYRDGEDLISNKDRIPMHDLDALPFPDRDVMHRHNLHIAQVEGARGCTHHCSFCSIHGFWTNNHKNKASTWRTKSSKRFVDEIEHLVKNHSVNRFHFVDSSFENPHMNTERMTSICQEIIERNLNITYHINLRTNIHSIITDEMMSMLIASGLSGIFLGVESFDENDLKTYSKGTSVEDCIKSIELLQKYPIITNIGIINFHPFSTIESLRKNAQYLRKYEFASRMLSTTQLIVFQGTPIYNRLKKGNLLLGEYYETANYKFVNEQVGVLCKFISDYKHRLNDRGNLFYKLDTYTNTHIHLLHHLKRYFENINDIKASVAVNQYEIGINRILNELNERNSLWFLELLDLAELQWDEDAAINITNQYLGEQELSELIKTLDKNNFSFHKKLVKINPKYILQL